VDKPLKSVTHGHCDATPTLDRCQIIGLGRIRLPCDLSLITSHISDCRQLIDIHISHGSVATYLRCGGMFKYELVANLPVSPTAKTNSESRLTFGEVMGNSLLSCLLTHGVECNRVFSFTLSIVRGKN